jgi:hypothetical protein
MRQAACRLVQSVYDLYVAAYFTRICRSPRRRARFSTFLGTISVTPD